jgi:hypothetical protein
VANIENTVWNAANVVNYSIHQVSVYSLSLGFAVSMFLECSELRRLVEVLPLCAAVVEVDSSSNLGSVQFNEIVWTCSTQCKITPPLEFISYFLVPLCINLWHPCETLKKKKNIPCNTSLYPDNYRLSVWRFMENLCKLSITHSTVCFCLIPISSLHPRFSCTTFFQPSKVNDNFDANIVITNVALYIKI